MHILFALTPYESRRMIARAVAARDDVQQAFRESYLIVAGGITNAYVVEALTGESIDKVHYTRGICMAGSFCVTPRDRAIKPMVFHDGASVDMPWQEALAECRPGTVFIKGANAVDPAGRAGVFLGSGTGGTIGSALGILRANGFPLVVPVGLEKLIPDVLAASRAVGLKRIDVSYGMPFGMMPLVGADVVTEVEALRILTGVEAVPVGAGGIDGSEGQVVFSAGGDPEAIEKTRALVEDISGEPPLTGDKQDCAGCQYDCAYQK